jgi:hypothetical protein
MWACTLVAPKRFERQEVPQPARAELPPGYVLLRPQVGGICGMSTAAISQVLPVITPVSKAIVGRSRRIIRVTRCMKL